MDQIMSVASSTNRRGPKVPAYVFLLAPAVTFMLLLYAYPFIASIVRSLLDKQGAFSFENYLKTLDLYTKDIAFTFAVTVFNTVCTAVLAILLAVYFRIRQNRITRILSALYKLPLFIPFVVVAQMMNSFLAPHGLLNVALAQLRLVDLKQPFSCSTLPAFPLDSSGSKFPSRFSSCTEDSR